MIFIGRTLNLYYFCSMQLGGSQQGRGRRPGLRSSARLAAATLREQVTSTSGGSSRGASNLSPQHVPPSPEQQDSESAETTSPANQTPSATVANLSGASAIEPQGAQSQTVEAVASASASPAGAVGGDANAVPGPSGTQSIEDFRNILGDIDIPEGIDPSFLAALPEEMRQEVISEHLR